MWMLVAVALGVQQGPEVRVYRMMQSGTELGRETVRAAGDTIDRTVVVPMLNLRLESRTEYDASGVFRRFTARVLNSSGDSLGDVMRALGAFGPHLIPRPTTAQRAIWEGMARVPASRSQPLFGLAPALSSSRGRCGMPWSSPRP